MLSLRLIRCVSVHAPLRVFSPYSNTLAITVPYTSSSVIGTSVQKAKDAQNRWTNVPLHVRKTAVTAWTEMVSNPMIAKKIAEEITLCMGKPITQSRSEVKTMVARAKHMITLADKALATIELENEDKSLIRKIVKEPVGVVAVLAPWNYPLLCAVNSIIPAILAGNGVVIKHSERTPSVGTFFAKTLENAGVEKDLVQSVMIKHAQVPKLLDNPLVSFVSFTGSVAGGRSVYRTIAARRFIDVGLELGGKDAAYVAEDADPLAAAIALVDGAMYNAGQSCCSIERVYVHQSHYTAFLDAAVAEASAYVLGNPLDEATTMGPLAIGSHGEFLQRQVANCVERGGRVLLGGKIVSDAAGKGVFFAPTILSNCNNNMEVMREESFGPILAVMPVNSDEEALHLMNDSKYGLTAAVYTNSIARVEAMAAKLNVGTVFLNRCDFVDPALPWSGRGDSGRGMNLSELGFGSYVRTKSLHFRLQK